MDGAAVIAFKVTLPKARPVVVQADYYRIEGGVITFRMVSPIGSYPIFVRCFAAGAWLSVENHTLAQYRKEGNK